MADRFGGFDLPSRTDVAALAWDLGSEDLLSEDYFAADAPLADITGSLATNEAADSAAMAGQVPVRGALGSSEAADSAAMAGLVPVGGVVAAIEPGFDVAGFGGEVPAVGSLAANDSADGMAITGTVLVIGALAAVEGQDGLAATNIIPRVASVLRPGGGTAFARLPQVSSRPRGLAVSAARPSAASGGARPRSVSVSRRP